MWPNPQEKADLITFTEEILNGKLHFLYSDADIENSIFSNFSCGARYLLDLFFTTSTLCVQTIRPSLSIAPQKEVHSLRLLTWVFSDLQPIKPDIKSIFKYNKIFLMSVNRSSRYAVQNKFWVLEKKILNYEVFMVDVCQ